MKFKKNLALIYGGDSSEWEVSVWSGQHVASHIDKNKYCVYEIMMRGNDWRVVKEGVQIEKTDFTFFRKGEKIYFDVAVIMIHGTPGEDGILQSYLERLHIPFTSCTSAVSALAFDKYACKCFLRDAGINMAREILLRQCEVVDEQKIVERLGLPLFVKPNCGGSSFGASRVKQIDELKPALERACKESSLVLVEEFISGRELTNGMLKTTGQSVVLPVTEIVSKNDFFDYQAKYLGASNELTPAPIPDSLRDKVQQITSKIYDFLGCKGFIRVDYIVKGEDVFFLEVNTIPGMTEMSLVPQQIRAAGITISAFLDLLIRDALDR